MAAGDTFSGKSSVAVGGFLTIQPATGLEAVIHNILWDSSSTDVRVEVYDGSTSLVFFLGSGAQIPGGLTNAHFHVTNGLYLRAKNNAGATALFSFDGMYTK